MSFAATAAPPVGVKVTQRSGEAVLSRIVGRRCRDSSRKRIAVLGLLAVTDGPAVQIRLDISEVSMGELGRSGL